MQRWEPVGKPVNKGARTPRQSPNQKKRDEQEEARKLVALQGGDPSVVTRKPPVRRGSRPRGGSYKTSKGDAQAKMADQAIEDHHQEVSSQDDHLAVVIQLDAYRPSHSQEASPDNAVAQKIVEEKPYIWSEADFTAEAQMAAEKQYAPSGKLTSEEAFKMRRAAEVAAWAEHQNRYSTRRKKPAKTDFEESGDCTSSVLPHQKEPSPSPARPAFKSSHGSASFSRSKK